MTNNVTQPRWPVIDGIPSVFSQDPKFQPRNKAGQSRDEIAAESVTEAMRRKSTIHGLSPRADALLALRKSGIDLDPKSLESQQRRQRIAKASI